MKTYLTTALTGLLLTGLALAAPAPQPRGHAFRPVDPRWVVETNYLKGTDDLPTSYVMVAPKDRDPNFGGYLKELRYYDKAGDKEPRKILRYYPSGRLATEIDNDGDVQHSRGFHANGKVASYLHWRAGEWLNGFSVSPDGKARHELKDGRGEIVRYGRRAGTRSHLWYHQGFPFLEKTYREGKLACVRLNDGSATLLVMPPSEFLLDFDELARNPLRGGRRGEQAKPYPQRRAEFIKGYEKRLKAAGRDWMGLGIETIRTGEGR